MNESGSVLTFPHLLAARADQAPERVAIVLDGVQSLTFGEWNDRANAVAHGLIARGVRRGDRVGLLFGGAQWLEYAVAYVAVQRAGAVAVPLSERLAASQVRQRMDRCEAALLVHPPAIPAPDAGCPTLRFPDLDDGDTSPVAVEVGPDDLGEILFTSGTTGDSKGVSATHGNLTFGVSGHPLVQQFDGLDYMQCAFPIGTTAGQAVVMLALTLDPAVVATSKFETESFCRVTESLGVGSLMLVPAMAIDMVNARVHERHDLSSVRLVASGSAMLPPATASALTQVFPNATILNTYGSTESAPRVTAMAFDPQRPASVGRPMGDTEVAVLGEDGQPLPPGEVGEVCLRSPAPLRAYYRDPEATAHTFGSGWIRMGDYGYLDEEGYLFLVDRDKDVVKVGGLKVSTLQVEAALYEHPAVADAAVVGVPHPVMGRMVAAAVVLRQPVDLLDLRGFLRERLAEYELPTRIMVVDELPRSTMRKVLKREIREMFLSTPDVPKIAPSTAAEVTLGRQWSEILGTDVVGIDDDFFALGGDSLKAAQLAARASDAFGVEVPASLVFDVPVLAHQAEWIATRAGGTAGAAGQPAFGSADTRAPSVPLSILGAPSRAGRRARHDDEGEEPSERPVPLSPFQERHLMWVVRNATNPPRTLPVAAAVRVTEPLDVAVLRRTLNEVARRHESLRTVFAQDGDAWTALVRRDLRPDFHVTAAGGGTREEREADAARFVREFVDRPFDVVAGPLFRAAVVRLADDDAVVVLDLDHLVADGLSIGVLLGEVGAIYPAFRAGEPSPLPPLPMQESEFFAWVRDQYDRTRPFWEEHLAGAPPAAGPLPGQRPQIREQSLTSVDFDLPPGMSERLRGAYREHGVTVFMAALAVWSTVLTRRTGAPEVVLTSPMSGRTRPEFQSLVGSVLQSPFFRMRTAGEPTFGELFAQARRTVVAATEHQFFPHYEFLRQVPYPARMSVEDWMPPPRLPGLASEPFGMDANVLSAQPVLGDADLNVPRLRLTASPGGPIRGALSYNRHAFDRPLVESLARDFLRLAEAALTDPDGRPSQVD